MVQRVSEFDLWRPSYGAAIVNVFVAGTSALASLYYDEALTEQAPNPQTLLSMLKGDGRKYGKFEKPLYTGQSYYLSIEGIEDTGVVRAPFSDLEGEDISLAVLTAPGSSYEQTVTDFVGQTVHINSYGNFVEGSGGVAATNTVTMLLAIAALTNGGEVIVPAGLYKINSFDVPEGVVIRGQGREATTLQSILGATSFTLVGNRSGFKDITLDGNSLSTGSIAVKSVGNDETIFSAVMVRRFERGVCFLGGKGHVWVDFSIENTEIGAELHGDTDAGDSTNGDKFEDLTWVGGLISVATTKGLSLSYEDAVCHNVHLIGVGFEDCLGTALEINGAQSCLFSSVWFDGNTKNINIQDDDDSLTPSTAENNDVIDVRFVGGRMEGGEIEVTGTCQDLVFENVKFEDVDFTLTTPVNNFVILKDCYEDESVTISGEATKLLRETRSNNGMSSGVTTSNVATKAWGITLEPGQIVYLEAKAIAKCRNSTDKAMYHIGCGAFMAGATLAYDTQTSNFNAGTIVTGQSSGATARIQSDSDSGTTGTLTLIDIKGEFIDNEIITDNGATPGSATVNGSLSSPSAALDSVGNVNLRAVYETDTNYAATFVVNGPEVEFRVTGVNNDTVEWNVHVDVVST